MVPGVRGTTWLAQCQRWQFKRNPDTTPMSDRDDLGRAWRVSPTDYLKQRPATCAIGKPTSCYVTMRDGVRLAVDVYLPEGADCAQRVAAIAVLTPY